MTTIAAWQGNGQAWIGGDSGAFGDDIVISVTDLKVWKTDHSLIGGTGSFRILELARDSKVSDAYELRDYIFQWYVERQVGFSEFGLSETELMIVTKKHIHFIGADLSVIECREKYGAVGAGASAALGALYALEAFTVEPKERVAQALKAAATHTEHARAPFKILSL